jgi:carbonic anhydrase
MDQMVETSQGQYPFAGVLGCVDSRVPPELVFDQGIGDIFSIRIAGNIVNEDILGSMEFACKVVGSKLILVLGHTSCGAVQGASDDVELGNLTGLVNKLKPAVDAVKKASAQQEAVSIDEIAETNVQMMVENIKQQSPILKDMLDNKEIAISGAMYDVSSGQVTFL